MKTVTYLEQEFQVPDWATHISADNANDSGDCEVWAFDSEPLPDTVGNMTIYFGPARSEMVGVLKVSAYPVKAL